MPYVSDGFSSKSYIAVTTSAMANWLTCSRSTFYATIKFHGPFSWWLRSFWKFFPEKAMITGMLTVRKKLQVIWSIVFSITISMVHMLLFQKGPTYKALHYKPVFINQTMLSHYLPIRALLVTISNGFGPLGCGMFKSMFLSPGMANMRVTPLLVELNYSLPLFFNRFWRSLVAFFKGGAGSMTGHKGNYAI